MHFHELRRIKTNPNFYWWKTELDVWPEILKVPHRSSGLKSFQPGNNWYTELSVDSILSNNHKAFCFQTRTSTDILFVFVKFQKLRENVKEKKKC